MLFPDLHVPLADESGKNQVGQGLPSGTSATGTFLSPVYTSTLNQFQSGFKSV